MTEQYGMNEDAAAAADSNFIRLSKTGGYKGQITMAKKVTSLKGTEGIEMTFKSEEGAEASFLTLWTINNKGEQIYGFKQLSALMACMRLKGVRGQQSEIEVYDHESKTDKKVSAFIFPGLMNVPVGIVLQNEEYLSNSGQLKNRMVIHSFFEASSRKTAKEVLNNSEAKTLDMILGSLQDKKLPANSGAQQQQSGDMPDYDSMPEYNEQY